jgi:uncharacterized damage-inducible protein DinB
MGGSMATATSKPTSAKSLAFGDLRREFEVTRKVLASMPEAHFAWKPHEKSMNLGRLAMHVATLPQWMRDTLEKDGLDMANPPKIRSEPENLNDLLQTFDENAAATLAALDRIDDAGLESTWTLRQGPNVLHSNSRRMILRLWCVNHMIHHRGQLCLYLRLLNIPVPTVYFNTADDPTWIFT